jgi:nucleoid DNA-binding protein
MGKNDTARVDARETDDVSLTDSDLMDAAIRALKTSGSFRLAGFGTFSIAKTKVRGSRGTAISTEPTRTVRFRPSRALTDAVLQPVTPDNSAEALELGFRRAVRTAIGRAHAAGLAVPGREDSIAIEYRPDGGRGVIAEDADWSPETWKKAR